MKKAIVTLLFISLTGTSFCQGILFDWAITYGSQHNDYGYSVTVDNNSNLISTGTLWGTNDFNPGDEEDILSSIGGTSDMYIQKFDSIGELLWVKQIGGEGAEIAYSLITDSQDNILITGVFTKIVDFDPGPGVVELDNNYDFDIFVLKLDPNGEFLWAKSIGNGHHTKSYSIDTDASDNIYITGFFNYGVDFDPSIDYNPLSSEGLTDIFILKWDSNGDYIWARNMGGPNGDYGKSIAVDDDGNIYSTGKFKSSAEFPATGSVFANELTSQGINDIFIQKLDSNANLIWAKRIGGVGQDGGLSIALDSSGNVFTTGYFSDIVDFDPSENETFKSASVGKDVFILKMNSDGEFLWVKSMGGSNQFEEGKSIFVDKDGYVYITGAMTGYDYSLDIFAQKLSNEGDVIWHKTIGHIERDIGYSIVADQFDNVYLTGRFAAVVDFDISDGIDNRYTAGYSDIFILKLKQCTPFYIVDSISAIESYTWIDGITYTENNNIATYTKTNSSVCDSIFILNLTIIPIPELEIENPTEFNVYPNPSNTLITLELDTNEVDSQVTIYDIGGKVVDRFKPGSEPIIELSIEGYKSGVYFIQLISTKNKKTIKFLKQ